MQHLSTVDIQPLILIILYWVWQVPHCTIHTVGARKTHA